MRLFLTILKLFLLAFIVVALPLIVYFQYPEFVEHFKTMEGVNHFLESYKTLSIFVYIGLQILQIVIAAIPGQFIQIAGGFAFGFWLSYLVSLIGITLGSAIAFGLARFLGKDGMYLIFGEDRMNRFVRQLNSRRAFAIVFMVFLMPGLPKDLFTYAAGISDFKFKPFMILALVGRTPALVISLLIGALANNQSYVGIIILLLVTVIFFLILTLKRKGLIAVIDKYYRKFSK